MVLCTFGWTLGLLVRPLDFGWSFGIFDWALGLLVGPLDGLLDF